MSAQWFIANILRGVRQAFEPFVGAIDSPAAFADLLASFGYKSLVTDAQQIEATFALVKQTYGAFETALQKVETLCDGNPSLAEIGDAVKDLGDAAAGVMRAIDGLKGTTGFAGLPAPLNQERFWQDFPLELGDALLHRYLETYQPKLFGVLTALGILGVEDVDTTGLPAFRRPYQSRQVYWKRIGLFVGHPDKLMDEVYRPDNVFKHDLFVTNLALLAEGFGLPVARVDLSEELLSAYYEGRPPSTVRQLFVPLFWDAGTGAEQGYTALDLIVAPIPPMGQPGGAPEGFVFFPVLQGQAGVGIEIAPGMNATLEGGFESAGALRLEVRPAGIQVVVPPTLGVSIGASAKLAVAPKQPMILVGVATSSRLEIQGLSIELAARGPVADLEYRAVLSIEAMTLLVYLAEGDGFLQRTMPSDGIVVRFTLQLGWSSESGFFFGVGGSLEATIPVHVSLFDILTIESIYVGLQAVSQASEVRVILAASAGLKLGPFSASVDRIGLIGKLTFPEGSGNLGPANLAFGFKPPDGAGLAIDASVLVGGGYLFIDNENGQYAGILQLEIKKKIALKAIGLISTRLPDGTKTFSLLVIITAEFPPIQLGYGFTLNGVGGLLGVNRTMVLEVLRAGIKQHTLDSILFPKDPVKNANKIISDLRSVFPPSEGRFVFGPMAQLGWGASIITASLGIIIELPKPVRLAILGQLRLVLPTEDKAVLLLRLDVLGTLDFDQNEASIDATLYDSRIAKFEISGDMAMRLSWGEIPLFAFSLGGFYPGYPPPPKFPTLDRLAISLSTGNDFRLRLESYLALTANSFQFGARLEIHVEKDVSLVGLFEVDAFIGFDVLVKWPPFWMEAGISGGASLKRNHKVILGIYLSATINGPRPCWHAWGVARFDFLGKHEASFDWTSDEGEAELPPPAGDPWLELRNALNDIRNWSTQLTGDGRSVVTLRATQAANDKVVVHPFGELTVRQRAVPLGVQITRLGGVPLPDPVTPDVRGFTIGTQDAGSDEVTRDPFAPGQFFDLKDEEKLNRPSFEGLPSGYTGIHPGAGLATLSQAMAVPLDFRYETIRIDDPRRLHAKERMDDHTPPKEYVSLAACLGAAGQAALRRSGESRFANPASDNRVKVNPPTYTITAKETLVPAEEKLVLSSYTEAAAWHTVQENPAGLQVVGAHEVQP